MKQAWLKAVTDRPWMMIFMVFIFILCASFGGKNLKFNGDYKVYFEANDPQRLAFEQIQAVFNKNDTANILIAPKNGNVYTPATLKLISEMTEQAWQTPLSMRVDSISNYQYSWSEYDDLTVEQLIDDPEKLDQQQIDRIQSIVKNEPNLSNRLVSQDGKVALLSVTVNLPDGDKSIANASISEYLKGLTEKYAASYPDHEFYHTGIVFMNTAFEQEAKQDAQTLVPLMFGIIIIVLWLMLRSVSATVATLVIVFTSIASTMGLAGWAGLDLTTATVNVPTLVMTLAVADCVHIVATMLFEIGQGKAKTEAIKDSMKLNFKPVLITSVTTAIGFLTLNFSNVPALKELGTVTALGVMLAFLFSVTLLPALLKVLPIKASSTDSQKNQPFVTFSQWVIAHHKQVLPLVLLISVAAVIASFSNKINDVPIEYFSPAATFRQAADFQNENLGGMSTIDFALFTGQDSGINQVQNLVAIEGFSQWLLTQPEVDHVSTITDVYKRLNKNMHGDDLSYYRLPENQQLAAQFLLLYEMSLPYNLDLNNQLNLDKSATRITATMQNLGSREFTEFEQRAYQWVESNAPQLQVLAGSQNLMFAHIGEANMKSMLKGTLLALVLISLILVFALGSWRMGVISLLPNLLPAGIGFGIWGLYSGEINMALSVVLSMALGIIVDDTVHFLTKYQHARLAGQSAEQAITYSFSNVGRALFITTVVLTLGFAVLTLSNFALNSDMGLLTGIIIVTALAVDFFFLPAFLLIFDNKEFPKDANYETTNG